MVSRWLPVVVWAAVIFAFSSVPSLSTHLGTWDLLLRKLAHMTEYAVLALLLLRATAPTPGRSPSPSATRAPTSSTRRSCGAGTARRSTWRSTPWAR